MLLEIKGFLEDVKVFKPDFDAILVWARVHVWSSDAKSETDGLGYAADFLRIEAGGSLCHHVACYVVLRFYHYESRFFCLASVVRKVASCVEAAAWRWVNGTGDFAF